MDGTEKVVEHLKMIQAVIDRQGRNNLWVKTWSLALIVAAMALIAIHYVHLSYFSLILIPFFLGFWILDGYFLWQERLFRKVCDEIRVRSDTNFDLAPIEHKNKSKCGRLPAIVSVTLIFFYLVAALCTFFVFVIIHFGKPGI